MKKDYLKEEIEKRATELDKLHPDWQQLYPSDFIDILNQGAAIQREFDAISYIQESYCIDDYEQAKEMREGMKKFAEQNKK